MPEKWLESRRIWLAFFAYSMVVAFSVQLVILPYLLPSWHAGHGLMVGLDSTSFHPLAAARAADIRQLGWSAWRINPDGGWIVGIASALYAAITPEPWVLVPMHSALHASSALLVFLIVDRIVGDRRAALVGALPCLMYPSAISWFAQFHVDPWFILGTLLFLYGWLELLRAGGRPWGAPARAAVSIVAGATLAWLVRPYAVYLLFVLSLASAAIVTAAIARRWIRGGSTRAAAGIAIGTSWIIAIVIGTLATSSAAGVWLNPPPGTQPAAAQPSHAAPAPSAAQALPAAPVPSAPSAPVPPVMPAAPAPPATPAVSGKPESPVATRLPGPLDEVLGALSHWRHEFRVGYPDAGLNVDLNVRFTTLGDIIAYVPRAAEIGFLSPFPAQWFQAGKKVGGTAMRRVAGLEMIGVYFALAWVPFVVWRRRGSADVYLVLLHCLAFTLMFSLVVTNVGALIRFRYAFLMTLTGLGVAGAVSALRRRSARRSIA